MIQNRLIFGGSGPETLAVEWSGLGTGLGFERKFGPDWYHRWLKLQAHPNRIEVSVGF
jgi:hypothetical protein